MPTLLRSIATVLFTVLLISVPAFAKDVSDLAGAWDIEVINRPNSAFRGTAYVPKGAGASITAKVITEDTCCGGVNYARVQQKSRISISGENIEVTSEIEKYLIRKEGNPNISYSPDDFSLEWLDENTLIGTLNGYTPVRWTRGGAAVS